MAGNMNSNTQIYCSITYTFCEWSNWFGQNMRTVRPRPFDAMIYSERDNMIARHELIDQDVKSFSHESIYVSVYLCVARRKIFLSSIGDAITQYR